MLYVEDDADIREVLSGMLKRYMGRLLVAANGEEGLELFEKEGADLVLTDIRMPKMDGIAMVEEIKRIAPDTAVIFATAFGDSDYLQKAIDLGAQGYLIKPIERDKLLERLNFIGDAIVNGKRKEAYLKLISTLFNAQKDLVALIDTKGHIHVYNDAFHRFCETLGCTDLEEIEEIVEHFPPIGEAIRSSDSVAEGLKKLHGEILAMEEGERTRYYKVYIEKVENFILLELSDVTDLKEEQEQLEEENLHDALTGIYNRKALESILEKRVDTDEEVCFIFGDIDHFKEINDTYGHLVGDEVLKEVVRRIRSRIRQNDRLVRWGGEEFLLIANIGRKNAVKLAEKLRRSVEEDSFGKVGKVTISFGVCCAEGLDRDRFDEVLERADRALYRAKTKGRNRVEACGDEM